MTATQLATLLGSLVGVGTLILAYLGVRRTNQAAIKAGVEKVAKEAEQARREDVAGERESWTGLAAEQREERRILREERAADEAQHRAQIQDVRDECARRIVVLQDELLHQQDLSTKRVRVLEVEIQALSTQLRKTP